MENGRSGSYYAVLCVRPDASCSEIRSAYRKLAMKWHPDRCGREPWAVDEAKRRFQQIQEAYQVLSDEGKRTLYDAGLYDPFEEDEEVEVTNCLGFSDFVQEMVSLMSNVRKEVKEISSRRSHTWTWISSRIFPVSRDRPSSLPLQQFCIIQLRSVISAFFCPACEHLLFSL